MLNIILTYNLKIIFLYPQAYIRYAFYLNKITKLTLGSKLQSIGIQAFFGSNIEGNLIIPASVANIGSKAFVYKDIFVYSEADKKENDRKNEGQDRGNTGANARGDEQHDQLIRKLSAVYCEQ